MTSGRLRRSQASTLTRSPGDTEKSSRGGVRPGAGRKPKHDAMVTTAFVITQEQVAWLKAQARYTGNSKSEIVRSALDALMAGINVDA